MARIATPNYSTDWSPNFIYLSANGTVWVDPKPVEGMRYLSLLNPTHGRCYFMRRDGEALEAKFGSEFNIVDRREKLHADSAEPIVTSQAMRDAAEAIRQIESIDTRYISETMLQALRKLAAATSDNAEQILRLQIGGK